MLRLFMLEESPTSFGADLDETAKRPLSHFNDRTRNDPNNFIHGAFSADSLIGSAGGARESDPKRLHIAIVWGMYVHPEHRSRGLGRWLIRSVLHRLARLPQIEYVRLAVTAGNNAALGLYESVGFETYGREPAALKVSGRNYDELLLSLKLN